MNGEISEMFALTANARYALRSGTMKHIVANYVSSEKFVFLPRKTKVIEHSAEKWFEQLKHLGVEDIFMLLPLTAKNRELSGFVNIHGGCMQCFLKSGEVTYFAPKWFFDSINRCWYVLYTEFEWNEHPKCKPSFNDNTSEFKIVLSEITELAENIDQSSWADIFRESLEILDGRRECENVNLLNLPERNLRLYCAASKADVFGGMGSWNDSPPIYAAEKGLSEEYNRLSNELFIQIQKALIFAVNMF